MFGILVPKNMDGSIGFQAQKTLDFKDRLEKEFELEVVLIDERYAYPSF